MLVIGLVGGTEKCREDVAKQLVGIDKNNICTLSLVGGVGSLCRGHELRSFVDTKRRESREKVLILTHTMSIEDGLYIREIGGYLWHMRGGKSCTIPMIREDFLVTKIVGGERKFPRYFDVQEAFHQTVMAHKARPNAA